MAWPRWAASSATMASVAVGWPSGASISGTVRSLAMPTRLRGFWDVGAAIGGPEQGGVLVGRDGLGAVRLGAALFCRTSCCRRSRCSPSRSASRLAVPVTVSLRAGRPPGPCPAQVLLRLRLGGCRCRAKATLVHFPPPKALASRLKGKVSAFADEVEDDPKSPGRCGTAGRSATADGQIQVDHALAVGQQRSRQASRQAVGRALHGLAGSGWFSTMRLLAVGLPVGSTL